MNNLDKIIADFLSRQFEGWKPYLTKEEQSVFYLYYIKRRTTLQIGFETNYSERNVKRILRSARKKINKILP